jgi:PAS domain S-box-containing protein
MRSEENRDNDAGPGELISGDLESLRPLIENAQDLVAVLREDATIGYIGPSVERLLGYKPEELMGRSILGLIHPDDRKPAEAALKFARGRPGLTQYAVTRLLHKNGTWRVHEASSYNLLDHPSVRGLVINSRDITDRREAEWVNRIQRDLAVKLSAMGDLDEALRISLDAILEATGMDSGCIHILDEETQGFRLAHHVGLSDTVVQLIKYYEPDSDRAVLIRDGNAFFTSYEGIPIRRGEGHLDEGIRGIAVVPILHEGRSIGVVIVSSHVTEVITDATRNVLEMMVGYVGQALARILLLSALRNSEERYRLLHDYAGEAIFTIDRDLRLVSVNRRACEQIGCQPEELMGKNVLELGMLHDEDFERAARNAQVLLSGEKEMIREEIRFVSRNGDVIVADVTSTALRDEKGEVTAVINIAKDVTEQRKAEEALKRSEEYFRALTENASDVITIVEADGTIRFESPSVEQALGYRPRELEGKNLFDFLHPDDLPTAADAFLEGANKSGNSSYMEVRFRHRDGSWRWFGGIGSNLMEDPNIRGILLNSQDITERRKADEALRESEEKFRLLAENAGDLVFRIGFKPERRFEYVSPSATAIIGYTPEEHYSDPDLGLNIVHPEDRHLLLEAARGEIPVGAPLVLRWIKKDGSMIWIELKNTAVFDEAGEVVAIEGIARDITDRKMVEEALRASEEQFRSTFEATGTAMFLIDHKAIISDANLEMEKVFGYSLDEVVGKMHYMELLMPEEVDKVKGYSRELARGEMEGPIVYEIKARHKTGRAIDALIGVNALPGIEKSVVSLIDITTTKEYEQQLEERAEQMRDFLDIAAHELRHPATLLKGYALTLEKHGSELEKEAWFDSLHAIEAGADRLVDVVEELLDVSRIERDRFPISRTRMALKPLVDRAADEMKARVDDREIHNRVGDDLGEAEVDPERIVRLLVILLDNAVKYSPPGSVVEIAGERRDAAITFSVMDRGEGIPEGDREKIFDRFYQVGDVLHHGGPGLGLGLYIGRRIVEAHDGEIWYEPREGGGSIFRFTILLS